MKIEKPRVKVREITAFGSIHLTFTNPMTVPSIVANTTRRLMDEPTQIVDILKIQEMINLKVVHDQDSDFEEKYFTDDEYSWNITNYDKDSMQIQMYFTYPLKVSTQDGIESAQISFDNSSLIYDFIGQELQNGTQLTHYIPPQHYN